VRLPRWVVVHHRRAVVIGHSLVASREPTMDTLLSLPLPVPSRHLSAPMTSTPTTPSTQTISS
ncbi:hypothetical protein BGZ97_007757, partial [Linnemannia gamsii]